MAYLTMALGASYSAQYIEHQPIVRIIGTMIPQADMIVKMKSK